VLFSGTIWGLLSYRVGNFYHGALVWRKRDMGITLRVTDIALSCTAQLEAHEDTRWQDGPLGRCWRGFLEEQD
jgi:hypothetical protein